MSKFLKRMLLAALLCMPWVTNAQTDTLTVADGTATNSYIPIYGFWTDAAQHNQIIYPASMTATLVGDSIKGMGFYMSSTSSTAWGITVTVRLGITSETTVNGIDNSTPLTQVWQGTFNGQGNLWINFSTPYAFMGGNLLVDIQTTSGSYGSGGFYGESQSGNTSICVYNGNSYSQSFIPKTSFIHVDGDFEVCYMPSNLVAEIDTNNIAISWNAATGVSGYNVYLNDSMVVNSITDTFYAFTNLTPNTEYSIAVTSACATSESPAIGGTYRTACSLMQIPFFTDFESDPYGVFPPCWTRTVAYNTDPSVNTVWAHSGTQSMYLQSSHQTTLFASQAVPLAGNNIKVNFWARLGYYYDSYNGGVQTQWIQAGVMTNPYDATTFTPLLYIEDMNSTWTNYEFSTYDLDATATYYVAFKYYGEYPYNSGSSAIDDILITTADGCAMPRRASVDSADVDFIELSWVSGCSGGSYELAYGTSPNVESATIVSDLIDTFYTVQNLNTNTNYYFWVRTMCSGDTTLWMPFGHARTACGEMVTPMYEDFRTFESYSNNIYCWTIMKSTPYDYADYDYPYVYVYNTNAYIYFYPQYGANNYNLIAMPHFNVPADEMSVEYNAYVGSNTTKIYAGYVTDLTDPTTFVALDSVTATSAATYEFNTMSVTDDTIWIAFKAITTGQYGYAYLNSVGVSHLSNCLRPDYLAIDSISHESAELHCNNTGADSYVVRYGTVNNINAESLTEVSASDTNFVFTGLTPSTHYYTWVRTICTGNDSSDWRVGPDFVTMCGEDYCVLEIEMHDSYGDGWNDHGFNYYMNGNMLGFITLENGSSGYESIALCAGDTIALTWVTGSFPGEVSFNISLAGVNFYSASTAQGLVAGETIYTRVGCPSCFAPTALAVDEIATTDESIDIHWVPFNASNDAWAVYVNGVFNGMATDTTYTIMGLTANTGYVVSVATVCGDGDTSDVITINASTACAGATCAVNVDLLDQYGYAWYYGPYYLNVYQNGNLKGSITGDYDYGNNLFHNTVIVCEGDSLELYVDDNNYTYYLQYSGYCITSLMGDTLAYVPMGNLMGGYQGMTDTIDCPACIAPTTINVTDITTTSATITWPDNGLGTAWILTVSSGTNVNTYETSVPTYSLTGLTNATQYYVTVQTVCGTDSSSMTNTSFVTDCDNITLPWDFYVNQASAYIGGTYSSMPVCWSRPEEYVSGNYTYPYYTTSYGGTIYLYGSNNNTMAATPLIPTAGNKIYAKFNIEYSYLSGATVTAGVIKNLNDPTTYIPIVNIPTVEGNSTQVEFLTDGVAGLSSTDTVYVAFRVNAEGNGYGYCYISYIHVQVSPDCQRPDSVTATNVTDVSATLSWSNTGASSYIVSYGNTAVVTTTNSINLTGLTPGTTYNVDIQAVCSTDSSIAYHFQFSTECNTMTLPYFESFENFTVYNQPNCWTMYNEYPDYNGNMTPYVYEYSYYAVTGTKVLYMGAPSSGGTMAVSPALTGYPINSLYVSFYTYGYYALEAGIMTDPTDTSTFIPLLNFGGSGSYNMTQVSFQTNTVTDTHSVYHIAIRLLPYSYSFTTYIDDISVVQMPPCSEEFTDAKITGITGNSANFNFTPGLGTNANSTYTVTLMDAGYNTVNTFTPTTTSIQLTGLNPNTEYNVCVSLTCGGTISAVSDTVNFSTLCADIEYYYSFDSTMTSNSAYYAPIGYGYYCRSYVQTIIDSARFAEMTGDIVGFAFMPLATSGADYFNHMDVYMANVSEIDLGTSWITPDSDHVFVHVINDANFYWDTLGWQQFVFDQRFTWDGHSNVLVSIRRDHGSYSSNYPSFSVHSNATTTAKTRYSYNDSYAYDINDPESSYSYNTYIQDYVGDLMFLSCGDACPAPSGMTVAEHDYQSATIQWNGNATSYDVALKAATDANWPTETNITGNSYILDNLTPGTAYIFRVRSVCDVDVVSNWVEFSFSTDSLPCFAPTNMWNTVSDLTTATFDWTVNGEETAWRIQVWNATFSQSFDVTTHPATVTGLTQATDYYATVVAVCGGGILESETSDTVAFTTAECQPVTNVAVSNIAQTSATVSWSGSAATYTIEYGQGDFEQGNGTTISDITTTTYNISGLTPDRNYSVYVRANCDATNYSAWSDRVQFRTLEQQGIADVNGVNVTIYPNPTTDNTTIALSGVSGEVTITIVDMNGRTVKTDSMSCDGDCVKTVEVSGLAEGAYFVRVNGEGVNMVKKLVVK